MSVKKHSAENNKRHSSEEGHEFTKKKLPAIDSSSVLEEKKDKDLKMPTKEKNKIDRELQEIYENSDGSLPDMRTFEKRKRTPLVTAFVFLLAACVFLGTVAWAGFFFFQPEIRFQEEKIILSISGDETAAIGKPVTYRVRYRNDQRIPLSKATLQIRYPEGFVFASSSVPATTAAGDEWELGALSEGGSGYIDVVGALYGSVNREQSFRAFLNYTPSNISSEFQKVATTNVKLSSSPFTLTVEGPAEIVAGKEYAVQIKVRQTGTLEGITSVLVVDPPGSFTKKGSSPESDQYAQYQWTIPASTEEFIVSLTGTWATAETGATLAAKVMGQHKGQTEPYLFAQSSYGAAVSQRNVSARIVVNGTASGTLSVAPGEILRGTIFVENTGDTAITNVRLRALFDAPSINRKSIFNWQELQDELDGAVVGEQIDSVVRRGSIQWDRNQLAALRELGPGKDVSIDFSLPIQGSDNSVVSELAGTPVAITAASEVQYDGSAGKELLAGSQVNLVLSSDSSLSVEHILKDSSKHQVTWLLSNTYHELQNIHIEADVYGDIAWDAENLVVPAGKAIFDEEKKQLRWDIEKMPVGVDVFALQFALTLKTDNPTQKNLVSKVRGRAVDAVTGKDVVIVGDEIVLHP